VHEDYRSLSCYRLDCALEDYNSAVTAFNNGHYRNTVNRAYYCVFHTIRSLLILDEKDFKRHSAVISEFRKCYIKTGIFDAKLSKIIEQTSDMRGESDYSDMINVSEEEAEKLLNDAKYFYDSVKPYVEKLIAENADTIAIDEPEP